MYFIYNVLYNNEIFLFFHFRLKIDSKKSTSGRLCMVFPRDEIPKRSILRLMTQKIPDYFTMQDAYTNAE